MRRGSSSPALVGLGAEFNTEFGLMAVFYLLSTVTLFLFFGRRRPDEGSGGDAPATHTV